MRVAPLCKEATSPRRFPLGPPRCGYRFVALVTQGDANARYAHAYFALGSVRVAALRLRVKKRWFGGTSVSSSLQSRSDVPIKAQGADKASSASLGETLGCDTHLMFVPFSLIQVPTGRH